MHHETRLEFQSDENVCRPRAHNTSKIDMHQIESALHPYTGFVARALPHRRFRRTSAVRVARLCNGELGAGGARQWPQGRYSRYWSESIE